ncbi:MAG: hypothetical protein RMK51_06860 [Meiothermus sp.]|nr:hypothetical protein [Meiothermus sp.]
MTILLGVAVLVGFAVLVVYMFGLLASSETTWNRALYLFAGVEAIAFAAAGYFFGREVHRQRAEVAEWRAGQAEQQRQQWCERALEAETRGQSLRAALLARAAEHPEFAEMARLSEALFPRN